MATWNTRRSSSWAARPWARRWGISPSLVPNTATRAHSRPFTRWIVDSVTAGLVARPGEHRAQPRLQARGVGVEVGHLQQGVEVVAVGLALAPTRSVEQVDRPAQAHAVAHVLQDRPAGAAPRHGGQAAQVRGQVDQLGRDLDVVDALGRPLHVLDRAAAA
jgi:hypothetical protein